MKKLSLLISIVLLLIVSSCSTSDKGSMNNPEAKIEFWNLVCNNISYNGEIDEANKTITVRGISNLDYIVGVSYKLSPGATISPNLESVVWKNMQQFTVSNQEEKSVYTVLIEVKDDSDVDAYSPVIIGYLPLNDHEYTTSFDAIKWEHLTHLNASFARAESDGSLNLNEVASRISETRDVAHANNVKTLISVHKKSPGSFTKAIESEAKRKKLAQQIVDFTRNNNLDGFDIDYEDYDNWNANFHNLLEFVKELHKIKSDNMLMTCAVETPWLDYGTEWHTYFDYINVMSYGYKALNSDEPVQHSPFSKFVEDILYWEEVFEAPKHKIVAGLPFYGFSWDDIPGRDKARGIRFHRILSAFADVDNIADRDSYSKTYYNGKNTIRQKCQYAVDNKYGGVMIWQLFQDAYDEKDKLINVVGETVKKK